MPDIEQLLSDAADYIARQLQLDAGLADDLAEAVADGHEPTLVRSAGVRGVAVVIRFEAAE